jgi:excisionase family DNA binding protein
MKTFKRHPGGVLDQAFYSPVELARIAGVHRSTVLNWIRSRRLYAMRLSPRVYRIPLGSAVRLLEPERVRPTRILKRPNARISIDRFDRELAREHRWPQRRRRPRG